MAAYDYVVKKLLWVALALLVISVACKSEPKEPVVTSTHPEAEAVEKNFKYEAEEKGYRPVTYLEEHTKNTTTRPVKLCYPAAVGFGADNTDGTTANIELQAREAGKDWETVYTYVNPTYKGELWEFPKYQDFENVEWRLKTTYIAGVLVAAFYTKCKGTR